MTYAGVSAGGGTAAIARVGATVLVANANTIEFTGIPTTYKALLLHISGRTTTGGTEYVNLRCNGNSTLGAYLSRRDLHMNDGTMQVATSVNDNKISVGYLRSGDVPHGVTQVTIQNYAAVGVHKAVQAFGNVIYGSTVTDWSTTRFAGVYLGDTNAITSLTLLPSGSQFATGTAATLYGLG